MLLHNKVVVINYKLVDVTVIGWVVFVLYFLHSKNIGGGRGNYKQGILP